MHNVSMTLSDYLSNRRETDAAFAARVGLKSHTTINRLKRGLTEASVELALAIELETGGAVDAADLSADVRKVRLATAGVDPVHAAEDATAPAAVSCGNAGDLAPLPHVASDGAGGVRC